MDKFIISSDSTCDLSEELLKANEIRLAPICVILGDKEYRDGINITAEEVINYVDETGVLPKTAANSVADYEDYFKEWTKGGAGVLHFCISSEDSSCYQNACIAAKEFENVYVVDSRQLSSGQGLLVMKACDYRKEGLSLKETFDKIMEIRMKARTSFILDRLDFLHKGGRCSLATLLAAKLLKIHPYIRMDNGALRAYKKYPGSMIRAAQMYVTDLAQEFTSYDKARMFITHCMASPEVVATVKEKVEELFDFNEIIETHAGSTVSSHCGRNTIGVLFVVE